MLSNRHYEKSSIFFATFKSPKSVFKYSTGSDFSPVALSAVLKKSFSFTSFISESSTFMSFTHFFSTISNFFASSL
eukprot:UN05803